MIPKNDEKRKFLRLDTDCAVSFAVGPQADKSKRIYHRVPAKNISVQGLAFEYTQEIALGSFLHLRLDFLSVNTTVKVRGEVQRCSKNHSDHDSPACYVIGVKFIGSHDHLGHIFLHCMHPRSNK